ncbi:uncharacterized protein K460DRAFT_396305 [Cucurbitaria berberidis CBS 394.84]|uniref:Fungal N-terminal domain-containing protein n=1 Tax=Cucurbitaria berberidis CBS 394.84 TaxID=1168544 RepID=A0A9P4GBK5_9PLEO|nr:uncharacterized protein K460DRAFT_396305 [Cucurbitaria berberidis CBS 394.84]KAF1842833.1 hypothetical protein K460DRAFT_396305 [Cucurbitaria berberidis CBS 394.84]
MSSHLTDTLVPQKIPRPDVKQAKGRSGKYVGPINFFYHCWIATGCARDVFYSELKQNILHHLDGWSASLSSEDFVILSLYMIGRSERTASPTICFISESNRYGKEARNVIKKSGILKNYSEFKTAHMSKDPGWGEELEQLARGGNTDTVRGEDLFQRQAFFDKSMPLRLVGMPIYVQDDKLSIHTATANAIQLQGQIYYLAPSHVFFERRPRPLLPLAIPDDDFEIDSDGELEVDDELETSITSLGSCSSGSRSDSSYVSQAGEESTSSNTVTHASASTPKMRPSDLADAMAAPFSFEQDHISSRLVDAETRSCSPGGTQHRSLAQLGSLFKWSIDQDWALIKMDEDIFLPSSHFGVSDLTMDKIALQAQDQTAVITHTASCDRIIGIVEVAGCQKSGFAYVMAARHILPELEKAVQRTEQTTSTAVFGIPVQGLSRIPSVRNTDEIADLKFQSDILKQQSVTNSPPVEKDNKPTSTKDYSATTTSVVTSPSFSATDAIQLAQISTRIWLLAKGILDDVVKTTMVNCEYVPEARKGPEKALEGLVRELATLKACFVKLAELMTEYGKPLPFPVPDWRDTLQACEQSITGSMSERRKSLKVFAFNSILKVKDINQLLKKITGHYRGLQICTSFLKLRIYLEKAKQTQRLLDAAPLQSMQSGGRTYSPNPLSVSSSVENVDSLHSSASLLGVPSSGMTFRLPMQSAAHEFYKDSEVLNQWLKSERLATHMVGSSMDPRKPMTSPEGSDKIAAMMFHLRGEVDDAIMIEENCAKRTIESRRTILSPFETMQQEAQKMLSDPRMNYTREVSHVDPAQPIETSVDWRAFESKPSPNSTAQQALSELTDLSSFRRKSLTEVNIGHEPLEWKSLCRRVLVERATLHGVERKACDLHWRYREDKGLSIRSIFSSDGNARTFITQHFPATGSSIPLTTTHADGNVLIEFPRSSCSKLENDFTDIRCIVPDTDSSKKLQTLLYTNNGKEDAQLIFYRPP